MRFGPSFVASGVPWVGIALPYDPSGALYQTFKTVIVVKAWDQTQKLWWVPETSLPAVRSLYEQYGFGASAPPAKILTPKTKATGYAALGLTDNAPPELVELTYKFWRREFGGDEHVTALRDIERAYTTIMRGAP